MPTVCQQKLYWGYWKSLRWHHNERDGVSNHQPHDCLLNRLFRRRSKKASKLRVTGLCEGNSPVTGEFPAQRASNAENVSTWWRHHYVGSRQSCPYPGESWIPLIKASDAVMRRFDVFLVVSLNKLLTNQGYRRFDVTIIALHPHALAWSWEWYFS